MYTKLTNNESVHLETFPKYDEALINEHIEERMDLVRSLISIGRYVREDAKIKVRQPLSEALLDGKNEELIKDLVPLIKEELNIKNIKFVNNLNEYMNLNVKPNFKEVGKVFGPLIKEFGSKLEALSEEEITKLQNNESINMTIGDEDRVITKDMVDIRISSKEGFNVGMENNNFIILDKTLTNELIKEGLARELISKVQNIRKENGYEIMDRINLYYNSDELVENSIKEFEEFIKKETLSLEIIKKDDIDKSYDLNGHETYIELERK